MLDLSTMGARKVPRENGTFGIRVVKVKTSNGEATETVLKDVQGEFPMSGSNEVKKAESVGMVGTSRGVTLNLGNYESARADVWVALPASSDEVKAKYDNAASFCDAQIQAIVQEIRSQTQG